MSDKETERVSEWQSDLDSEWVSVTNWMREWVSDKVTERESEWQSDRGEVTDGWQRDLESEWQSDWERDKKLEKTYLKKLFKTFF